MCDCSIFPSYSLAFLSTKFIFCDLSNKISCILHTSEILTHDVHFIQLLLNNTQMNMFYKLCCCRNYYTVGFGRLCEYMRYFLVKREMCSFLIKECHFVTLRTSI